MEKENLKKWLSLNASIQKMVNESILPEGCEYDTYKMLAFSMVQILNGKGLCKLLEIPYDEERIDSSGFKGTRIVFKWDDVEFVSYESEV